MPVTIVFDGLHSANWWIKDSASSFSSSSDFFLFNRSFICQSKFQISSHIFILSKRSLQSFYMEEAILQMTSTIVFHPLDLLYRITPTLASRELLFSGTIIFLSAIYGINFITICKSGKTIRSNCYFYVLISSSVGVLCQSSLSVSSTSSGCLHSLFIPPELYVFFNPIGKLPGVWTKIPYFAQHPKRSFR